MKRIRIRNAAVWNLYKKEKNKKCKKKLWKIEKNKNKKCCSWNPFVFQLHQLGQLHQSILLSYFQRE